MDEKTPFSEWFDIRKKDHLAALNNYIKNDQWPKHFMPADVYVDDAQIQVVRRSIVKAWIDQHCTSAYRSGERPIHE